MFKPTEQTKPFYDIIETALKNRGQKKDDFNSHADYRQPNYVVRMCEELLKAMDRPDIPLQRVLDREQYASGHVDYHTKFALYCHELASSEPAAKMSPPAPAESTSRASRMSRP